MDEPRLVKNIWFQNRWFQSQLALMAVYVGNLQQSTNLFPF